MRRITACTRSMTCPKSTSAVAREMPYCEEFLICESRRAVRISAFEGTQPVLRQSPPMRCFSMSVTFAFTAAAM
jgi:hypothetical protein